MRHHRDQLGKDLLDLLLSRWGALRTEAPIPAADLQRADVRFVPRVDLPAALGLLAGMASRPCLFELFSEAPSREALLGCQRKLLQWRHALRKRLPDAEPACWVLCAERPTRAMSALGLTPAAEGPRGVHSNPLGLFVVVIDELPHTRDTVLLRLLGREATRERALDALDALALGSEALDQIVGLFVHYSTLSTDPEDPPMPVDLSRYYAWKEQQRAEGRAEGEATGRLIGAVEARLRRVLTDDELARLRRRIDRDGRDAVHQRALALGDTDLTRWVAGKRVRAN